MKADAATGAIEDGLAREAVFSACADTNIDLVVQAYGRVRPAAARFSWLSPRTPIPSFVPSFRAGSS